MEKRRAISDGICITVSEVGLHWQIFKKMYFK